MVEGQTPAMALQGRERLAAAWAVQIARRLHRTALFIVGRFPGEDAVTAAEVGGFRRTLDCALESDKSG